MNNIFKYKKYSTVIFLFLLFLFTFIVGGLQPQNLDMYFHLKMGEVIAHEGKIINQDIFAHHGVVNSETSNMQAETREFLPVEWLFQVFLYTFVSKFGFSSYRIFVGVFTVLQVGVVYLLCRRIIRTNVLFSLILSLSYTLLCSPFFIARPHIIVYTLFITVLFILLKYLLYDKNYIFLILPITYLWTNLHASVFMAVYLCGAYVVVCLVASLTNKGIYLKKTKALTLLTVGVFLCSILPPEGLNAYKFSWMHYQYSYMVRMMITEWGPIYASPLLFIFYLLTTGIVYGCFFYICLEKKMFTKSLWLVPILILIIPGFFSVRLIYFGYLSFTIIAGWVLTQINISQFKKRALFILSVGAVIVLTVEAYIAIKAYSNVVIPVKAADFIGKEHIKGNMFNQFGYGGYLEYRLYPQHKVFMDGRLDAYFCCELKEWYDLVLSAKVSLGEVNKALDKTLNKYRISYIVLVTRNDPSGQVISSLLEDNREWRLAFHDDVSEVWVKNDGKNTDLFNTSTQYLSYTSKVNHKNKIFSDPSMSLTFTYPSNLNVTKPNNQLIILNDEKHPNEKDALLIYSTTVPNSKGDLNLPFAVVGHMEQAIAINKSGFDAKILTFSDGSNETQLFLLRNGRQTIVIRPPKSGSIEPQTILDIVESISIQH